MPFIEFRRRLYRLKHGENLLGPDGRANVRISELHAGSCVEISVEKSGVFARAPKGRVEVNGKELLSEPIPLFHGDQLSVSGSELVFVDDGGELAVHTDLPEPRAEPSEQIVGVLRKVDGDQSYFIQGSGLRLGREKHCDVIIPDRTVSRLHAEITLSGRDYVIRDVGRSTTKINGRTASGPQRLKPGDVLEIGKCRLSFTRQRLHDMGGAPNSPATPVRSTVADAHTIIGRRKRGGRPFTWLLTAALAVLVALTLLV